MEKHVTIAELKARAKGQLLGKYGTVIPAILIVETIMLMLTSMTTFALDTQSTTGLVLQFVIECLLQLFAAILIAGQTYMYLNVACGGKINISDVFYGFTHHPDKAILIQLIQLLICLVWFFPCFICLGLLYFTDSTMILIPLSVTFCIGLIGSVIVTLQYSQSFYILMDFPEFSAVQCLKYSKQIMKGSKARRFYLDVSFIPLYLLGILSCCIGFLFLIPYMNTTYTNFYLELMSRQDAPADN